MSYSAFNSATVKVSYLASYVIITASLSILAIAYLIFMKITRKNITPLIETLILLILALFQYSIGILIAIYTSQLISPIGSHQDYAPISSK